MEENMKNRNAIKVLLVVLCLVAAGIVFSCMTKTQKTNSSVAQAASQAETETQTEETEPETVPKVCVHVCGSVAIPGVYYLDEGSRIHEAVALAGGFTEDAAGDAINLAEAVSDGEQIYIPSKKDVENGYSTEELTKIGDGLVNINTASLEELKTLPGIGDMKAEAIIAYREECGNFTSVEDIMNVSGIKDSSYERIKDYIKV